MPKEKGHWRCKKHKENCKSYVQSLVEELNRRKFKPTKEDLKLVEFVE